ncbi:amidohydrolase family protein [Amycolatopsis jejuensis]|uniref:amidohydrolase family protein n=1 Tax=Amycolatopsis jejuensis TaxID=330084 RepID=UPI00052695FE|nr:amidohydrolase family protein [Amycolatopsis jejuensis]
MIEGTLVVDAVVHGYHSPPETYRHPAAGQVVEALYSGYHRVFSPRGDRRWQLDRERFERVDADVLGHALFAESQVDYAIYHDIPLYGMYEGGASPLWVGRDLRARYPGRVALFGGIWPHTPDPIGEVDRLVDEHGCVGLKFYPYDIYDGVGQSVRMDDREAVYPILEHAQKRGIRSVAVHKAVAMSGCPVSPFGVADVEDALVAFPGLNFQIVHGGFAFLEETALQLSYFPNASVVLESATAFLVNAPLRFAEILARLLMTGAHDRIIWATGCTALHPRPLIEAFHEFQLPQEMIDGYGLQPLTPKLKAAILGGNIARILDLKVTPFERGELAEPWTAKAVTA